MARRLRILHDSFSGRHAADAQSMLRGERDLRPNADRGIASDHTLTSEIEQRGVASRVQGMRDHQLDMEITMKRFTILPVLLAVSLVATVAFAASDRKVIASFETLSNSGISGQAELQAMPKGTTLIHETIRGLVPNTQYVSIAYQNGTCGTTGSASTVVSRFTANANGVANFTQQVNQDLLDIQSVSIQLASDLSVQACAV